MPNFKDIFKVIHPEGRADSAAPAEGDAKARIEADISSNKVMIYMKGTRDFPQCGFSAATIAVFNELGVPYETRNVLEDDQLREGIKEFSQWPTIPQVYVAGKFIGGSDIVTELHGRGELSRIVNTAIGE